MKVLDAIIKYEDFSWIIYIDIIGVLVSTRITYTYAFNNHITYIPPFPLLPSEIIDVFTTRFLVFVSWFVQSVDEVISTGFNICFG